MSIGGRIDRRAFLSSAAAGLVSAASNLAEADEPPQGGPTREVFPGVATAHPIPGHPIDLAGKRMVFTNWAYIRPGDLDWLNAEGKSVYVSGSEGPFGAHYQGIDTPRGIRLVAQPAARIWRVGRPGRIRQDGGVLRSWSNGGYWESKDAEKWERKAQLVDPPDFGREINVFPDPSAPAAERYKCLWVDEVSAAEFDAYRAKRPGDWEPRALLHYGDAGKVTVIRGAVSPDGIAWKTLPDPVVVEYSDTEIVGYYDERLRKCVLYTRQWAAGAYTRRLPVDIRNSWTGIGRRAIGRSETSDFRRFPVSRTILEPTPDMAPSDQLYTNCRTTVPGAPDHHLMFPAVWHTDEDNTSIRLLSSNDGELWHYVPGGPVLDTQAFGEWNGGCVWTSPGLVELPNGDWALPYRGDNVPHKYPRGQRVADEGYAIWPKGRLVALEATDRGEFTTVAFMPPGRRLLINAVTKRVGSIVVEVAGAGGRTFADCAPIVGDQFRAPVTWKGQDDLGHKDGQSVTLRFRMEKARLYGLEFM